MSPATRGSAPAEWNVLATSREECQRRLRRALSPVARLRRCGFRNVFVAQVADLEAFFTAVGELRERRPILDACIGKILPIERTFRVDAPRFDEQLKVETVPFLERLAGHSFHIRIERRGHKGIINSHACERALGDALCAALESRGQQPVVVFRDPDVVLAVEVVGDVAGLGWVTRELSQRWPFVRID